MYDEEDEQDFHDAPSFEIMISEDEEVMVSSFVLEGQKIKFPNADLVVDQNGINKLSDPSAHFSSIKIDPKKMREMQVLGKGSAGEVRRVIYEVGGKVYTFAVKSINATQQEHRKQLINDLREYIYGGHSEYLIQFYNCYFHNGLVKQVIEFMDVGSLRFLIEGKLKLTEEEMATILGKILRGLHYIHTQRHSIHRDIKPENILLNSRGEVKITDFGVSKCIEHSCGRSIVGTVIYMSPERLSADDKSHTYTCDIWSLGLILWELATHLPVPYSILGGEKFNYFKVSQKILNDSPPQLSSPPFSPELCDFLRRCLDKNETTRPSAQQLLNHPWIQARQGKANLRELIERARFS